MAWIIFLNYYFFLKVINLKINSLSWDMQFASYEWCFKVNLIYFSQIFHFKIYFLKNENPVCPKVKANEMGSNYAGRTKRQFKTRLGEHLGYIGNERSEEPSRLHFSLPGHSKHDLQALGIEQVRSQDPFIIKAREHKYIQLFDSYRRGLNQEPWV